MSAHRLAVVVLTWNGRDDTLACLASLRGEIGPDDSVIVCDNGSQDGTEEAVRAAHPWAEFLQNGGNLGYAGGNNTGLRRALERGFAWILLLNNDTIVPPGALAALLRVAENRPAAGAFQPLLVRASDPDTIDSAGHVIFRCPGAIDALIGHPVADAGSDPTPVFGACGAAALLRAAALAKAGLFDEGFFVLVEDVDLMFRIRLAGYDVLLVPSVHVLHKRGISGRRQRPAAARRRRYWLQRNIIALGLRYWPARYLVLAAPLLALRVVQAAILGPLIAERCLPLWSRSLAMRRDARAKMRGLGLDAWFSARPGKVNGSAGPDHSRGLCAHRSEPPR
jgi:hypothetical protein